MSNERKTEPSLDDGFAFLPTPHPRGSRTTFKHGKYPMFMYISPHVDAFYNLALEEHMLKTRFDGNILLLWQSYRTVVIGRHQNLHEEVDIAFVKENDINIVRRSTGGGAVYHDGGNLNFSFISNAQGSSDATMKYFTAPIISALRELELNAHLSGRNDILIDSSKISGNAQMLWGKRILHHGTLLFDSDLSVLSTVLKVRPEKFRSKTTKSVRGRVGNITDFLPSPMTMKEFTNHLMTSITRQQTPNPLPLSEEDERVIQALRRDKYLSWEWNYARSPKSDLRWLERFDGGFLEVYISIAKGKITQCEFYGDFLALRPSEDIAAALIGIPFDPDAVRGALLEYAQKAFPLEDYFGSISLDEILHCIFSAT